MSLKVCLPGMVQRGEISQEQADYMAEVYDQIEGKYRGKGSDASVAASATRDTVAQLEAETFQRKRQAILQMAAQRTALGNLQAFDGKMGRAAMAILDHDDRAPYENFEARRYAIETRAHNFMEGILTNFRRTLTGAARKPALLKDVTREAFGENTGNLAAKELAQAWIKTAEYLRRRFNQAGGAIGNLDNWGLPQGHNALKVRNAGYKVWRDFIVDKLDLGKMFDDAGQPMTRQSLEATLTHVYNNIHTDGWFDRTPGASGGKKVANRRADSRFLIFRDADSWMAYQEAFGSNNPFDAMMGHISGMSRDIALMEILGPNPNATIRWLKDMVEKDAQLGDGSLLRNARNSTKRIQEMYDTITGTANTPIDERVAAYAQGTRAFLSSALLGRAVLSATTDVGFQWTTRMFNGLPAANVISSYAKMLKPGDGRKAVRSGLLADEWSKRGAGQARYTGEALGPEVASRVNDAVLRASGLSPWTQAGRWAFGMEVMGMLADNADKPFSKLNPRFARMLERYGVGSEDWQKIRKTPIHDEDGLHVLRAIDIEDEALGDRVLGMIGSETNYAVPTATIRARSFMNVGQPGTIIGEVARSALMFKSFPVSMIMLHGWRMVDRPGFAGKFKYAAAMSVSTMMMGALVLQMKDITGGKDPRPMADPRFWTQAFIQGGGAGIFGDFIMSTENRVGGGIAETMAGPMAGFIEDVAAVPWELTKGEDANVTGKLLKLPERYTPGGSLWYAQLAFKREILDQVREALDPEYWESWDRMESYARRTGQEYWWEPGQSVPGRAPEMETALEAMPE